MHQRWFAVVVALCLVTTHARAQAGIVTVGAVIFGAKKVVQDLENAATLMTGNAQIAANQTATQISGLITQLESAARDNFATPVDNLGKDIRAVALQLQQTTQIVNAMLDRQRDCAFRELDLFTAGLQTVVANLKSGVPTLKDASPRLTAFLFEGKRTPNVVPRQGGRVVITGFDLWNDAAPQISIYDDARRNVYVQPVADRGKNKDEVSFVVPPGLISQHPGECLQINVKTFKRKTFLGIFQQGLMETANLFLPMCVPDLFDLQVKISASHHYRTSTKKERTLSAKRVGWGNSNCSQRANVSTTTRWDAEIPDGWRIVRVDVLNVDERNQHNIGVSFDDKSATAAGWLDDASCVNLLFGQNFLHDSHWYADLRPVIAGDDPQEATASSVSLPEPVRVPDTRMCIELDRAPQSVGDSTFWYTVTPVLRQPAYVDVNGKSERVIAELDSSYTYASHKITTGRAMSHSDTWRGFLLNADYNPAAVNGKSQLCVKLTAQQQCGY